MVQTRVVVLLTDNTTSGPTDTQIEPKPAMLEYGGEVNILNDKTLRLLCCQNSSKPHVFVAQKLRFDHLVNSDVIKTAQTELADLLAAMFVDQRDGLLLQLTSHRHYNLMFLMDALVNQVNSKLHERRLRLERGHVRYSQLLEDQSALGSHLDTQFHFSHTDGLLSWLLNEYRMRAALATCQEVVDVEYVVVHCEKEDVRFCVKLTIMFVAMSELSLGGLCGLRCYFSADDIITASLARTSLTAHMRSVMENERANNAAKMLLLCHVLTTGSHVDAANVQLLGLAHLACEQRDTRPERIERIRSADPSAKAMPNYYSIALAELQKLELCQQEMCSGFKAMQSCLAQYMEHAQQLHLCRQIFHHNLNKMLHNSQQVEKLMSNLHH